MRRSSPGGAHALNEWSFVWGTPPPRPPESYDAVLVFGGAMHANQDARHPWLHDETVWLRQLLGRGVPVLGICLGVQLLARAGGSWVGPLPKPEIGWAEVELTEAGAADPVLSALPRSFEAFQWHHYTYGLPDGAVELARNGACTQGFRLGQRCWGVQFHPEVTAVQLEGWVVDPDDPPPDPGVLPRRDPAQDRPLERARPHHLRRVPRGRRARPGTLRVAVPHVSRGRWQLRRARGLGTF